MITREHCPLGSKCPAEKFISVTAQAIINREPKPKVETGWLIENPDTTRAVYYLSLNPAVTGFWTRDSLMATRFGRREDAEAVRNYLHDHILTLTDCKVVEHQWQ